MQDPKGCGASRITYRLRNKERIFQLGAAEAKAAGE